MRSHLVTSRGPVLDKVEHVGEREFTLARAKIGELMMRLELAEDLIEKRGFTDEWKKHKR